MNKRIIVMIFIILLFLGILFFLVYNNKSNLENNSNNNESGNVIDQNENIKINIIIKDRIFNAILENNETTRELIKLFPMTVNMTDHLSNEKFYDLPKSLPTNSSRPSKINNGDIMLFGSNTLVLFYDTFSTSYSYTRLGKIDDASDLKLVLGNTDVEITFQIP